MALYTTLEEARAAFAPSVVTIGNFDGVHLGHRELVRRVLSAAKRLNAKPSVLTFDPHPAHIVAPERAPKLLMPLSERVALFLQSGIEQVLVLPFDASISALSPAAFFDHILCQALGAQAVVVGDNFHFGNKQTGNIVTLSDLGRGHGVEVDIAPTYYCRGVVVSSSEIRRLVRHGAVTRAERLLGRPFGLSGHVVRGAGRGSKQTVPTLNLEPVNEVLPAHGVYVTRTFDPATGRKWHSVTNVGTRPTFDDGHVTVETFLLDPLNDPSPEFIHVDFFFRVREERQFESAEALKQQIFRDVGRAQKWFRRYKRFVRKKSA